MYEFGNTIYVWLIFIIWISRWQRLCNYIRKPRVGDVKWHSLKSGEDNLHYLHIADAKNVKMESNGNFAQKSFWDTINAEEN